MKVEGRVLIFEDINFPEEYCFKLKNNKNHSWKETKIPIDSTKYKMLQCQRCGMIVAGIKKDNYLPVSYICFSKQPPEKQMSCDELCVLDILT